MEYALFLTPLAVALVSICGVFLMTKVMDRRDAEHLEGATADLDDHQDMVADEVLEQRPSNIPRPILRQTLNEGRLADIRRFQQLGDQPFTHGSIHIRRTTGDGKFVVKRAKKTRAQKAGSKK